MTKFTLIDENNIYTYEISCINQQKINDEIKQYATEKVVTLKDSGPSGIMHRHLLNQITNAYDEIVEYKFTESSMILGSKYRGECDAEITATTKSYPTLYKAINNERPFENLVNYLEGNPITPTNMRTNLYYTISPKEYKYQYDTHMSDKEKQQLITDYISSLKFQLLKITPFNKINHELEFLMTMDNSKEQQRLIRKLQSEIDEARNNTVHFQKLSQFLESEFSVKDPSKLLTKKK